jgi:cellulose synthase/poly-beta-1,6-N-acetylglucosamine synthase-like glycosyltransferase
MGIGQALLWIYVLAFGGYCLVVLTGASLSSRGQIKTKRTEAPLSVGMVVPAYNEMVHAECIRAAVATAHAIHARIVVVDDGSTDGSGAILDRLCRDGGACLIRHARNRGKAAALNTGIAALQTDLVLTLDADTTLETAAVLDAVLPFTEPGIGAVALMIDGTGNSHVARAQIAEYRYILNFERAALARFGIVFTVPGSASVWRCRALAEIGGFQSRTCAEDTDATISLALAGWQIIVAPGVRAATECPLSVGALMRQRSRWIWGTIQAAGFALIHLMTKCPPWNPISAVVFVAVTALNIFGFLLAVNVLWRFSAGELGWNEVLAGCVLVVTTLIRLALVRWRQGHAGGTVFEVLVRLSTMQIANTAAFWYGLVTGRAGKISW